MSLLTLSVGTLVKINSKEEVEKLHGNGFVGVQKYEKQYGMIEAVVPDVGCYYLEGFYYGWDDRLVKKAENPIYIYVLDNIEGKFAKRYCSNDDIEAKENIIEELRYYLTEDNAIIIEALYGNKDTLEEITMKERIKYD